MSNIILLGHVIKTKTGYMALVNIPKLDMHLFQRDISRTKAIHLANKYIRQRNDFNKARKLRFCGWE